ncbi:hypothetical protein ACRXCV_00250 (plasmid) [Halobacteriovorax sp. GFR7]|uniref:hypothetical protein n=1 Tax=unclassified Halobacteriovorax TaxID=2639665 RepID=UPI003D96CF23
MENLVNNKPANYAYLVLDQSYKAHVAWMNQLQEAHAFIIADGGEPEPKDLEVLADVERKVSELREALLKVLA